MVSTSAVPVARSETACIAKNGRQQGISEGAVSTKSCDPGGCFQTFSGHFARPNACLRAHRKIKTRRRAIAESTPLAAPPESGRFAALAVLTGPFQPHGSGNERPRRPDDSAYIEQRSNVAASGTLDRYPRPVFFSCHPCSMSRCASQVSNALCNVSHSPHESSVEPLAIRGLRKESRERKFSHSLRPGKK